MDQITLSFTNEKSIVKKLKRKTEQQVNQLIEATQNLEFFDKLRKLIEKEKEKEKNKQLIELPDQNFQLSFPQIHRRICQLLDFRIYSPGQLVFCKEDPSDYFYIILKGQIAIVVDQTEAEIKSNEKNNPFLKNPEIAAYLLSQLKVNPNFSLRTLLLIRLLQKSILSVKHILSLIKFIKELVYKSKNQQVAHISEGEIRSQWISSSIRRREKIKVFKKQMNFHRKLVQFTNRYQQRIYFTLCELIKLTIDNRINFDMVRDQHLFFTRSLFNKKVITTLSKGQSFGEYGLLNHRKRTATIICIGSESTFMGMLDQHSYDQTISEVDRIKMKVSAICN